MRNMNAVMPRYGATTRATLNITAAVGREKRANRIPVPSANDSRPTSDSTVITKCGAIPFGDDVAVADRRQRLDAEEERAPEPAADRRRRNAGERVGTAREIREREQRVGAEVSADGQPEELAAS